MNMSQSPDLRFSALKENSILSFNAASKLPLDFIEFDVQVLSNPLVCLGSPHSFFFFSSYNLVPPRDRRPYHVGV